MQLLKVLARVLEYPTEELQQSKDALVAAVLEDSRLPRQNKEQLLTCIDRLCDGDLMDLQEAYVGTFAQPGPKGRAARWERIVDALFTKHYGLWEELMDAEGRALVAEAVQEELAEDGVDLPDDPAQDYTLFELSEYRNRQAKYVVAGQRNYDMLGLDWRLPLWDLDFTAFWERQPLAHKLDESLYRETLMKLDWGGVWRDFSAPRYLSPTWIRPLRLMAKIAHAPLGVARWRRFEKRWFAYHMDVVGNYGAATPAEVRRDRGRHRNAISWHVRRYLEAKGKTS